MKIFTGFLNFINYFTLKITLIKSKIIIQEFVLNYL